MPPSPIPQNSYFGKLFEDTVLTDLCSKNILLTNQPLFLNWKKIDSVFLLSNHLLNSISVMTLQIPSLKVLSTLVWLTFIIIIRLPILHFCPWIIPPFPPIYERKNIVTIYSPLSRTTVHFFYALALLENPQLLWLCFPFYLPTHLCCDINFLVKPYLGSNWN